MLSFWQLNGSIFCLLFGIYFLLYSYFGHLQPSTGCCYPQAMWKNNFLCIAELRRNMASGNVVVTETWRGSSAGGTLMPCDFCTNHLQILHLLKVVEAECMLTSIALNYFSWVAEWIFLPECVAEPSFHQNTHTHAGLHQ